MAIKSLNSVCDLEKLGIGNMVTGLSSRGTLVPLISAGICPDFFNPVQMMITTDKNTCYYVPCEMKNVIDGKMSLGDKYQTFVRGNKETARLFDYIDGRLAA